MKALKVEDEIEVRLSKLSMNDWTEIRNLYERIIAHDGRFSKENPKNCNSTGVKHIPFTIEEPVVGDVRSFLGDRDLLVPFDWVHWDEGVKMINRQDGKFSDVSAVDVVKLFTMMIRNDRFNEGAFASIFDAGVAEKLLKRLIELSPK